jgi:hypothetical protein
LASPFPIQLDASTSFVLSHSARGSFKRTKALAVFVADATGGIAAFASGVPLGADPGG